MANSQYYYNDKGFCIIKAAVETKELSNLQNIIVERYTEIYDRMSSFTELPALSSPSFDNLISQCDSIWPSFNYEFVKTLRSSCSLNSFFYRTILPIIGSFSSTPVRDFNFEGFDLFVNCPKNTRLAYTPHRESHYYPKRKNFLNTWLPIFSNRDKDTSTLRVYPGSHKWEDLGFVEFRGPSLNAKLANSFLQYRSIIEQEHQDSWEDLSLELGDIVIFHKDLIHSSTHNNSVNPAYALVGRVFDLSDDLTFSSKMAEKHYELK